MVRTSAPWSWSWSRVADVVAGLVLLPMLALVAARLLRIDDRSGRVFALLTLLPVALLPAYVVALVMLAARRWLLGAVAMTVVLVHLAWTLPTIGLSKSADDGATGPAFSVIAANVAANNAVPEQVAATLAAAQADVVVVLELTPALQEALDGAGFAERYSHRIEDARTDFFGAGIYSVHPLESAQRIDLAGRPTVRATVLVGDRRVDLLAVHTIQPMADLRTLRRQYVALRGMADDTTGPLVLAGDFNATGQHRPFRELLRSRLRDSHVERGRGFARTWPVGTAAPPFALLDHVLVSDEVDVLRVVEFGIPGSDHRGVEAELQLR